ncbi:MAG TPA: hypothetical protein VLT89_12825 [Usitatibacter sp.]|nr:hypothetical protein [Usitatibacter sp.]
MKIDARRTLLALAATFAAAQPHAQDNNGIAKLIDLRGNVLVSQATGLAAGKDSERLMDGMRVITTSNSGAVVQFDNGCRVELKENQRFEVQRDKPCEALLAQVESMVRPTVVAAAGPAPALLTPGTAVQAGLVGLSVWRWRQNENTVSPN